MSFSNLPQCAACKAQRCQSAMQRDVLCRRRCGLPVGQRVRFKLCDNLAMPQSARSRVKTCQCCQQVSATLFRVVANASGTWQLVCPACRAGLEAQPFYRYGGTWKADKRH